MNLTCTVPETGNKAAIVFASDNFSRFITGHLVAERNSSINVHDVINQTVDTIRKFHPEHNEVTKLVSDGGAENNNKLVDQLIETIDIPPLEKLIAKKDIQFSNSPIEAVNKIFKRYLRTKKPQTYHELKEVTDEFVEIYNTIRPHGSLKGLTPIEAYQNKQAKDYAQVMQQARVERIEINKSKHCGIC